jgi:hypothetical protein
MSKKQPPRVQLNFEPDYIPEQPDQPSIDVDIQDLDVQEELDELDVPSVVEKEKINERDIFDNIPDEETGEVNPNFIYEEKPVVKPKPVKEKKKRKPMSEEHKQKLALAREKAMAVRKAKAEEKKKMKALENEEKELLKAQKVKKVQKLKKEVEEPIEEVVQKPQQIIASSGITKKDLEDAQFEAIIEKDHTTTTAIQISRWFKQVGYVLLIVGSFVLFL